MVADPYFDGPVVVINGRVAALLHRPLVRLLREARDRGEDLDAEVLSTVTAIERAARAYTTGRVMSDRGTDRLLSADIRSSSEAYEWLTTSAVPDRLDCTERNVVRLIATNRLASIKVGAAHLVEPAELARFLEDRAQAG